MWQEDTRSVKMLLMRQVHWERVGNSCRFYHLLTSRIASAFSLVYLWATVIPYTSTRGRGREDHKKTDIHMSVSIIYTTCGMCQAHAKPCTRLPLCPIQHNPMRWVPMLFTFCRWRNWNLEKLSAPQISLLSSDFSATKNLFILTLCT
jgi:hypothetical protein